MNYSEGVHALGYHLHAPFDPPQILLYTCGLSKALGIRRPILEAARHQTRSQQQVIRRSTRRSRPKEVISLLDVLTRWAAVCMTYPCVNLSDID